MTDWLTDWLDWLTDWLTGYLTLTTDPLSPKTIAASFDKMTKINKSVFQILVTSTDFASMRWEIK